MSENIVIDQVKPTAIETGQNYLIKTVTHYYCGTITNIVGDDIILENPIIVGETGSEAEAIKTGKFQKFEKYPLQHILINRGGVIAYIPYPHKL